jgi:hypothetical protein
MEIITDAVDSPWSKDPQLWEQISNFFGIFDEKDMSSDETETEARFGAAKTVRRVRKCWIADPVSKVVRSFP